MRRARCSSEVRCLSARPTRRACISGRDGLAHSFPVSNACDCWRGKGQAWHIFNILPGSSARFASCKLHSHGNWFTAPYRSRKLLKTLLLFFFYLFVSCCYFIFFIRVHWYIFFCLNALWSKGAVLLAYEVWDMCCSWHCVWTAVIWQGKTTYMKYM